MRPSAISAVRWRCARRASRWCNLPPHYAIRASSNRLASGCCKARALPDGENPYVVVTLAAVLCDLNEYEDALTAAHAAVALDPSNPAALNVAARCVRELAGVIERSPAPNRDALLAVRACADDFARRAAAADPEP